MAGTASGPSAIAGTARSKPAGSDVDGIGPTFQDYGEAMQEAARIGTQDDMVARVQPSPYGKGFVVRLFPIEFLLDPLLRAQFARPVEYDQL